MFKGKLRWAMIYWFFIIVLISYMDRVNLAVAAPAILKEFKLTFSQLGLIMGIFTLGYAVANLFSGFLGRRYSPSKVIITILVLWSIMTCATGLAVGFVTLFLARVLFGIFEGPMTPLMIGQTGTWMLPRERPVAYGLWFSAMPLGVLFGLSISTAIITNYDWRTIFYFFGGAGIILAVISHFILVDTPAKHKSITPEELNLIESSYDTPTESGATGRSYGQLLKDPWVWCVCAGNFLFAFTYWATMNWLPTYFVTARGTTILKSGALSSMPWILGVAGMLVTGWLSGKFGKGYAANWLSGVSFAAVPFIAYAVMTPSTNVSLFCFSVAMFFVVAGISLNASTLTAIWGRLDVAIVSSITTAFFCLAGFVAPYFVGYILDVTKSFNMAYFTFAAFSFIAGCLYLALFWKEKKLRAASTASQPVSPIAAEKA